VIILCAYTVFVIWLAYWDASRIKADKPVDHQRNGMLHGCWFSLMLFVTLWTKAWLLLLCMPFIGRVVFDVALNLFRGKPWDYVTPWLHDPKHYDSVAFFDRIEYRVFKSGAWPKVLYSAIILTLIIIHYAKYNKG
jgi:hypothetical protein